MPFGSSRSCKIFQDFSECLRHIAQYKLMSITLYTLTITNYLDDFLFVALTLRLCYTMMSDFIQLCEEIGCPIADEKTCWPEPIVTFLGTLMNRITKSLSIPLDKIHKARALIQFAIDNRKVTIKFIQQLTGTLNFLNRAIVLGRPFTRCMYLKLTTKGKNGKELKPHHHTYLNADFIQDCNVWLYFLQHAETCHKSVCRPFVDFFPMEESAQILNFYSDAAKNEKFGIGAVHQNHWLYSRWPRNFLQQYNPSIEFLELYAVTVALYVWQNLPILNHGRVIIFCDNQAVQQMINKLSLSCVHCMKLVHLIALLGIENNIRIFMQYVRSRDNVLADSLSRADFKCFWTFAGDTMNREPDIIPNWLHDVTRIYKDDFSKLLPLSFR